MTQQQQQAFKFAGLTDEMLAKARERIGVKRAYVNPWHSETTRDNVRHWAWSYGDANPLFYDEEYARKTKYKAVIAPGTFLYSTNCGPLWHPGARSHGAGLPGIHRLWTGDSWEWYKTLPLGQRITATTALKDIVEKPRSQYAPRMFQEIEEVEFTNQNGLVLARSWSHNMAYERGRPKEKGKYMDIQRHKYTKEEMEKIGQDYDNEPLQGAKPRFWEDVRDGQDIGYTIHGPLTVMSVIAFFQGWGGHYCMTDKVLRNYFQAHPAAAIPDPSTNIPDVPTRAHYDPWFAKEIGFSAGGYDIGAMRISWFGMLCSNWMGDDGFLHKLSVEMRRPNFLADTTWLRGRLVRKYTEGGDHLVDVEMWADNQRGERHATGNATIILPTRTKPDFSPGTARLP